MGILRTDKISGLEKEKRQNPNLVSNGDFSDSSITGWTAYNAVVSHDSGVGGRIKVDDSAAAGGWSNAAYVINTEPGASYRFEVRASATDSDTQYVGYYQGTYDTAGTAPTVYSSEITTTPSVHYFDLIATGSTVTIMLIANNNGVVYFDNVSFRKTDGNSIGGSVHFDGSDYLAVTPTNQFEFRGTEFTIEMWVNIAATSSICGTFFSKGNNNSVGTEFISLQTTGNNTIPGFFFRSGSALVSGPSLELNKWYHLAVTRSGNTFRLFVDGKLVDSATTNSNDLAIGVTGGVSVGGQSYDLSANTRKFIGSLSNVRILKGTALYTSDFTVPVHELQPIGDTILLCCNNPDSVGADGTGNTITANGNPVNSTENPGLTRDFTGGTEFRGVTTFDTQGYFVPPSGTTEQRGRGRGIFGGAYLTPQGANASIEYIETSSSGNGLDFGDMSSTAMMSTALADSTRSVLAGGYSAPAAINTIEFITISSTSNTTNFGDLSESKRHMAACASSTKGVWSGGTTTGSTNCVTTLDNVTIQSLGNAVDYGDLSAARRSHGGASSPTRGVFASGSTNTPTPAGAMNVIDYITIASGGTAQDFGDRTVTVREIGASSDSTRMVMGGGYEPAVTNVIDYVTIATTGNAQDFGDLYLSRPYANGLSNSIRGIFGGGSISPVYSNTIDYVTIQSTGNATDFGDLIQQRLGYANAACDSHGGIS